MSEAGTNSGAVPGRKRPLIWIEQLVLYRTISPVDVIRTIPFSKGLNIIQGESNESERDFESGHGIGKTTLCRLIRFCLGETTFGQKHLVGEVRHDFPHAHIGALIEIGGSKWAVLRHLGSRGRSCAVEGQNLDALIDLADAPRFETFLERLDSAFLNGASIAESLSSGQKLQWTHLLSMCSRDQEARYDCFWNWRHVRSESGTPRFGKPKVDAGLCVRAVMGLLDAAEPQLRKKLEGLEKTLEETKAEINKKRQEPVFNINRLKNSLTTEYGVADSSAATELDPENLFSLPEAVTKRLEALRQSVAEIEAQLSPLDRQISLAAASLLEPKELHEQLESAGKATGEGNDALLDDLNQLRSIRQFIRDAEAALCRYGNVLIGECNIVVARVEGLEQDLRNQQLSVLPAVSTREQRAAELAEQARRQQTVIDRMQQRLDALNKQKNDLVDKLRSLNEKIHRMPGLLTELLDWNETLAGRKPNTDLQALEHKVADTEADIATAKRQLASLVAAQVERAKRLQERFDRIVKATLTKAFTGVLDIDEDGINFRIVRGESLSGEAYETLAVLLGDLALMLESDQGENHHPAFLLHDSPREADLNLLIYQNLLGVADTEMRTAEDRGDMPYQYIVTTTTPPSQALKQKNVVRLTMGGGVHSLFGKQLEAARPSAPALGLFMTTEEP